MSIKTNNILSFLKYKTILILLIQSVTLVCGSQVKKIGLPLISSFPKNIYNASTQNWSMVQNSKGFIYIANNDGLLEYDGQHWSLYTIPNKSVVRSLLAVGDTIYIGAFEEFGYFAPDKTGRPVFHSLITLVPDTCKLFDEIWNIHKTNEGIVFQSFRYLFVFNQGKLAIIEPSAGNFGHSYQVGNEVFIVDYGFGLLKLNRNKLEPVSSDRMFKYHELRCVLPHTDKQLLVGLVNNGLFILEAGKLKPWVSKVNQQLIENSVFCGIELGSSNYAFGSILNGVYITNKQGEVLQHINRYKGLLNNTVLSLYEDTQGNLWLGLDNGINYLEINSPHSIFDYNFHIGSTYASIIHEGILYAGTNQGLFFADLATLDNSVSESVDFTIVPGTEGQVWCLEVIDNQLLCGHNFGCFRIENGTAEKIAGDRGYWTFIMHKGRADTLIAGTYNGLTVLVRQGNTWINAGKIEGFEESSRKIVQDEKGALWIAHGYRGIFMVEITDDLTTVTRYMLLDAKHGLPAELPYNVHRINQDLIFSSKEGFFEFDGTARTFYRSDKYNQIFKDDHAIDNIFIDESGNLWYSAFGHMGIMRLLEDGSYSRVTAPFNRINTMLIQSYENVYAYDSRNVFIGSQRGLFHYDPYFKKDYQKNEPVHFREVIFSGKDSTIVFCNPSTGLYGQPEYTHKAPRIPFSENSVSFRFSTPSFESIGNTNFAYRLRGFEENWSNYEQNSFKEYTNLKEGRYSFEVKAITIYAAESMANTYDFVILPPFYRSNAAYVLYTAIIAFIIVGNIVYIRRRISRAKTREKEQYSKKLIDQESSFREKALISEKEIINLRNQSLQSEIIYKNQELANTTLHLVHKNKILNAIKGKLISLKDGLSDKTEINQLIGKINKELRNEKFQKLFDNYFDDVHQDFLARIKEKHPSITPKELRLCAYLKMNLTTKEIAPLMNISVRGVEIGRYRLRKKLGLDREENLINYLLCF